MLFTPHSVAFFSADRFALTSRRPDRSVAAFRLLCADRIIFRILLPFSAPTASLPTIPSSFFREEHVTRRLPLLCLHCFHPRSSLLLSFHSFGRISDASHLSCQPVSLGPLLCASKYPATYIPAVLSTLPFDSPRFPHFCPRTVYSAPPQKRSRRINAAAPVQTGSAEIPKPEFLS